MHVPSALLLAVPALQWQAPALPQPNLLAPVQPQTDHVLAAIAAGRKACTPTWSGLAKMSSPLASAASCGRRSTRHFDICTLDAA